jgi:hypothetical protein
MFDVLYEVTCKNLVHLGLRPWSTALKFSVIVKVFSIQQTNSPSRNSYFLLSRPEASGSPPKKVAPDIGLVPPSEEKSSRTRKHSDSSRVATDLPGASNGTQDVSLADMSPPQAKEMDILSLGLPRLSTGRQLSMLHFCCAFL